MKYLNTVTAPLHFLFFFFCLIRPTIFLLAPFQFAPFLSNESTFLNTPSSLYLNSKFFKSSQTTLSDEFQKSVLEGLLSLNTKCDKILQTQAQHSNEIELLKANYNGFNTWARGSYRNLYGDYQALKTRFIVRFGPDDDDDAGTPSASQNDGGDDGGDEDPMQS